MRISVIACGVRGWGEGGCVLSPLLPQCGSCLFENLSSSNFVFLIRESGIIFQYFPNINYGYIISGITMEKYLLFTYKQAKVLV